MQKVKPYVSSKAAVKSMDNGGRFYNLLTKADDGEITQAELSKAAGVFANKPLMHLYMAMSIIELPDQESVTSMLSNELKRDNLEHKPLRLTIPEANNNLHLGKTAILHGVPHYSTSKTEFNGFIMFPIMVNNVTTFTMIPIIDQYDVYELKDENSDDVFLLAHTRSKTKLESVSMRVGGFLKPLKKDKEADQEDVFLEACYYTVL